MRSESIKRTGVGDDYQCRISRAGPDVSGERPAAAPHVAEHNGQCGGLIKWTPALNGGVLPMIVAGLAFSTVTPAAAAANVGAQPVHPTGADLASLDDSQTKSTFESETWTASGDSPLLPIRTKDVTIFCSEELKYDRIEVRLRRSLLRRADVDWGEGLTGVRMFDIHLTGDFEIEPVRGGWMLSGEIPNPSAWSMLPPLMLLEFEDAPNRLVQLNPEAVSVDLTAWIRGGLESIVEGAEYRINFHTQAVAEGRGDPSARQDRIDEAEADLRQARRNLRRLRPQIEINPTKYPDSGEIPKGRTRSSPRTDTESQSTTAPQ